MHQRKQERIRRVGLLRPRKKPLLLWNLLFIQKTSISWRIFWNMVTQNVAEDAPKHSPILPRQKKPESGSWKKISKGACGMDKILEVLKALGIPVAYDHFAEGESPEPPFICYLCPGSNNFSADGKVYYKINQVNIELYTDRKDPAVEQKLEDALDAASIFYNKTEVWIDSEKLYEVLYQFEMEV